MIRQQNFRYSAQCPHQARANPEQILIAASIAKVRISKNHSNIPQIQNYRMLIVDSKKSNSVDQ